MRQAVRPERKNRPAASRAVFLLARLFLRPFALREYHAGCAVLTASCFFFIPTMMKAIEITRPGAPEVLQLCERPLPELKAGEILIKVHAAGVNRPDVFQRLGRYPVPPGASDLPGLEVAGEIVAGELDGSGFAKGDMVCALVPGGGYAEYCAAPLVQCLPLPRGWTAQQAAALPETFFTVWSNVFDRAGLAEGETLLVQGGTSGIGVTAIQLATALGHRVFATAGTDEKCRACEALGRGAGHQLPQRGFRRGGEAGYRRQGRRRDPRHGRRRLHSPRNRCAGR